MTNELGLYTTIFARMMNSHRHHHSEHTVRVVPQPKYQTQGFRRPTDNIMYRVLVNPVYLPTGPCPTYDI
jgi:hypothetical protein